MAVVPGRGAVSAAAMEERVAEGMSLVPEKRELFVTMSVEDNLRLGGFRRRRTAGFSDTLVGDVASSSRASPERRGQLAGTLVRRRAPDARHGARADERDRGS